MEHKTFKFNPKYTITNTIANNLLKIERIKEGIKNLPITAHLLSSLRKTAKLSTVHYSTQIEGNRLSQDEVSSILLQNKEIKNRVRDEKEIKGYYVAIDYAEKLAKKKGNISENDIKILHALVEGGGSLKVKPTEYRNGQNVITDSLSGRIVYMPPEAKDVEGLMKAFIKWLNNPDDTPVPIKAAIAHYQFVTIHPYFDGNGRTARLLTTLILHKFGYDLKGIYSLEEYYAKDLNGYYEAITIGDHHNYYMGRADADITKWVEYFINGMAIAFNSVYKQAEKNKESKDKTKALRELDLKQRQILGLFENQKYITTKDVAGFFNFSPRAARFLIQNWVSQNFLTPHGEGKSRKYSLGEKYESIVKADK